MTNERNEHFLTPTLIPSSHTLSLFLSFIKARIAYEHNKSKTKKDDSTRFQYLNDKFQN